MLRKIITINQKRGARLHRRGKLKNVNSFAVRGHCEHGGVRVEGEGEYCCRIASSSELMNLPPLWDWKNPNEGALSLAKSQVQPKSPSGSAKLRTLSDDVAKRFPAELNDIIWIAPTWASRSTTLWLLRTEEKWGIKKMWRWEDMRSQEKSGEKNRRPSKTVTVPSLDPG